ncbi:MAG: octanoyl-[GcvH]:protein N-octanoyltransferase [Solirubrobacteraceae bacterium]|nr:octanoyl-[GcvH]:protein N-octanoyltransferase [Solirubrobacteraceae bacterium]
MGSAELNIYRPAPTVAFGRLDAQRSGYGAALDAARAHGFAPLLRQPGGHAAAYHEGSLVIELHGAGGIPGIRGRFEEGARLITAALVGLGVDARTGAVPGEYCPGDWSVNLAGRVKLSGLAQRVRRDRYLLGAHIVCADPEPVRAVLVDVYAALAIDFDPATVGVPGPPIDDVEHALREAFSANVEGLLAQ